MRLIFICLSLFALVNCTSTRNAIAPIAQTMTNFICATPEIERAIIRREVDIVTAPNKVRIECAIDSREGLNTLPPALPQNDSAQ